MTFSSLLNTKYCNIDTKVNLLSLSFSISVFLLVVGTSSQSLIRWTLKVIFFSSVISKTSHYFLEKVFTSVILLKDIRRGDLYLSLSLTFVVTDLCVT